MLIQTILKNIMRDEGSTQNQLAKKLKISRQAVSEMLRSDGDMRLSTVLFILETLGYTFQITKDGGKDE